MLQVGATGMNIEDNIVRLPLYSSFLHPNNSFSNTCNLCCSLKVTVHEINGTGGTWRAGNCT
jgi:hypothetical protein